MKGNLYEKKEKNGLAHSRNFGKFNSYLGRELLVYDEMSICGG